MQRKDIDEAEFAEIQAEMTDPKVFPGDITMITGRHEDLGAVVLVQCGGLFAVLADDVEIVDQMSPAVEGNA